MSPERSVTYVSERTNGLHNNIVPGFEAQEKRGIKGANDRARNGELQERFNRALQIYSDSRARPERAPDLLGGEELAAGNRWPGGNGPGYPEGIPTSGEGTVREGDVPAGRAKGPVVLPPDHSNDLPRKQPEHTQTQQVCRIRASKSHKV